MLKCSVSHPLEKTETFLSASMFKFFFSQTKGKTKSPANRRSPPWLFAEHCKQNCKQCHVHYEQYDPQICGRRHCFVSEHQISRVL